MKVVIIGGNPMGGCPPRPGFGDSTSTPRSSCWNEAVTSRTRTAACRTSLVVSSRTKDDLLLHTPASLFDRFRLDVRVDTEAVAVDTSTNIVMARDLAKDQSYEIGYDYLILSPGASPVIPPIPGIERAMPLRTVEDVERLVAKVENAPRTAVVVGGGFIGLELAENLVARGIATTVVETTDQVLAPLDPEMASPVADELRRHGVALHLGDSVEEVTSESVRLASGQIIPADLVVVAIGVRPDGTRTNRGALHRGSRRHRGRRVQPHQRRERLRDR